MKKELIKIPASLKDLQESRENITITNIDDLTGY